MGRHLGGLSDGCIEYRWGNGWICAEQNSMEGTAWGSRQSEWLQGYGLQAATQGGVPMRECAYAHAGCRDRACNCATCHCLRRPSPPAIPAPPRPIPACNLEQPACLANTRPGPYRLRQILPAGVPGPLLPARSDAAGVSQQQGLSRWRLRSAAGALVCGIRVRAVGTCSLWCITSFVCTTCKERKPAVRYMGVGSHTGRRGLPGQGMCS